MPFKVNEDPLVYEAAEAKIQADLERQPHGVPTAPALNQEHLDAVKDRKLRELIEIRRSLWT
jgi:hypothetical protein